MHRDSVRSYYQKSAAKESRNLISVPRRVDMLATEVAGRGLHSNHNSKASGRPELSYRNTGRAHTTKVSACGHCQSFAAQQKLWVLSFPQSFSAAQEPHAFAGALCVQKPCPAGWHCGSFDDQQ